ncbi:MAG: hypothetical protein VXW98_03875 [Actinomycetota bacterium]|nr:hypothetical protein [Actinomycetota bacterium]
MAVVRMAVFHGIVLVFLSWIVVSTDEATHETFVTDEATHEIFVADRAKMTGSFRLLRTKKK